MRSPTVVCKATYRRAATGEHMVCTFRVDHDSVCSWYWAAREDDEADPAREDVDVLIENIAAGRCDEYLEAILAAAHGRKRARRDSPRPYGRAGVL